MRPSVWLLWIIIPLPLAGQGPVDGYIKGKGKLDLAPSFSFNSAERFEGAGGILYDEVYKGQMLGLFAEYGLSKKVDVLVNASAVFTPLQSGLQDGGIYVKYRPLYTSAGRAGKLGVLLSTGASFPLTDYKPLSTGALGQKAITVPAKLVLQLESPLGVFLNVTGAYHFRLDRLDQEDITEIRRLRPEYEPVAPKNFTTALLKIGFPARHFYLDGWAEWLYTRGGSDYVQNVPELPQTYGVSYTQLGGTAYYSDNGRTGFYLSGAYILKGRNTSRIKRITFGMVFKVGG